MSTWASHHRVSGSGGDQAETAADGAGGLPHDVADEATAGLVRVCQRFYGNTAARLSEFVVSSGACAYGGYPDIDALSKQ
jgi:hypothetical protein